MPIKGVTEKEEQIIQNILKPYMSKYEFFYYGSRVKGNFRPLSDLDILLKPNAGINLTDIDDIKLSFDESLLPYVVNITYNIEEGFYNLIKDSLVKI